MLLLTEEALGRRGKHINFKFQLGVVLVSFLSLVTSLVEVIGQFLHTDF
jgi:hypothetical protein